MKEEKYYSKLKLNDSNQISGLCGKCGTSFYMYGDRPSSRFCPSCGTEIVVMPMILSRFKELQDMYKKGYEKGSGEAMEKDTKDEIKKNLTKTTIKEYILEVIQEQVGDEEYIEDITNNIVDETKKNIFLFSLRKRIKK